ncbi:hypothetical protein N9U59_01395 [Gammaproteobacteria bacterium]|nr:hypothetical protein [Gammaproteobacteria bacterium]
MKVGIIGFGFVGRALRNALKSSVDCIEIDPKLNTDITDMANHDPEIAFICLPTPMKNDGTQNIDIVNDVIDQINKFNKDMLIVIKSTILPKNVNDLSKKTKNLVINPEFLRENFADEDFINSEIIVFGGDFDNCSRLSHFYKNHTKCICHDHTFTDGLSASLIKYTINSFLALKVVFFNEMKSVFDNLGSQEKWLDFIKALSKDKRMGSSHMHVPGPDGRYGFGGPCFPKDVSALIEFSKEIGDELSLLKKANTINNSIRAQYNDLTSREIEQNIKYNSNEEE